jgi:histone H2A
VEDPATCVEKLNASPWHAGGVKATTMVTQAQKSAWARTYIRKKTVTRSNRAGLKFPVGRVHRHLKKAVIQTRISAGAPVYLTAVLEYLAAEVLELAGNATRDNKRHRITPRFVQLAIRQDNELHELLDNVVVSEGGVIPQIHKSLLPKSGKAKRVA